MVALWGAWWWKSSLYCFARGVAVALSVVGEQVGCRVIGKPAGIYNTALRNEGPNRQFCNMLALPVGGTRARQKWAVKLWGRTALCLVSEGKCASM